MIVNSEYENFYNYIKSLGFVLGPGVNKYIFEKNEIYITILNYVYYNNGEYIGTYLLKDLASLKKLERSVKLKNLLK